MITWGVRTETTQKCFLHNNIYKNSRKSEKIENKGISKKEKVTENENGKETEKENEK